MLTRIAEIHRALAFARLHARAGPTPRKRTRSKVAGEPRNPNPKESSPAPEESKGPAPKELPAHPGEN
jgi:hypothetical protein